jgi:hypothetical protein
MSRSIATILCHLLFAMSGVFERTMRRCVFTQHPMRTPTLRRYETNLIRVNGETEPKALSPDVNFHVNTFKQTEQTRHSKDTSRNCKFVRETRDRRNMAGL